MSSALYAQSEPEAICFHRATEKILARARQLVDVKKEDGFSALHLASLNNHRDVAEILVKEVRNGAKKGFPPACISLYLSVSPLLSAPQSYEGDLLLVAVNRYDMFGCGTARRVVSMQHFQRLVGLK